MIKQETKDAIAKQSLEWRQELLRFLYSGTTANEFADAFRDADGDLTTDGDEIASAFGVDEPDEPDNSEFELAAERLHEAICENRRQDAIDIINEVTGTRYRSVREQTNLFPDRCSIL